MRFSESWLREWVNPDITTDELSHQLSMAGLEVDGVETAAPAFSGVVVGEILSREQHPDADKLGVCQVNVGGDENLQIVCGAKNAAAGMKVPVATVGAKLPGDFKIKKAKLRGVQSLGMICSASELGLAESSEGIMALPVEATPGQDFRDLLSLDDALIEVDLTPDRGDCLSIAGIAREVSVINAVALNKPAIDVVKAEHDETLPVEIQAPQGCPRYVCRIVKGIDVNAPTPDWMVEKLRRGGIRAINPVVDITNYVMLELGQPMHGFDLAQLADGILVRMAGQGEKLTLLDGSEIALTEDSLVIADHKRVLALAGIMGGEDSGVTDSTKDILFESAFFNPLAITGKARNYGLHTDSSHRFERGVDWQLQVEAIERATGLLIEIAGGEAGPVNEVVSKDDLPSTGQIHLRSERVSQILGIEIEDEHIEQILVMLGMTLDKSAVGWWVTAPSSRFDIALEVDLIEEIARIYGYENIPTNRAVASQDMHPTKEIGFDLLKAKRLLVARDYQESITYSFISPELADILTPGEERIKLANPISADMAIMRGSLWAGLIQAMQHNISRQQNRIRLFESGLSFKQHGGIVQKPMFAGLVSGPVNEEQWDADKRQVDFFDLKGDLEAVLAMTADSASFSFQKAENPVLHPGQAAKVLRNGEEIGWIGMLHPEIEKKFGLGIKTYLFEVELDALSEGKLPAFEALSRFPSIRRDLALVMHEGLDFSDVEKCVKSSASTIVKDIRLFDVYTGDNVDSGRKSLALSLILQDSSKTLTDEEVENAVHGVLSALSSELNVELRD
ncbi:MAG: phenylalanine--tRNA ligase subunit beta [Gammaproteobacteria bacterium]|nr:phenylalanine--tRNA ligase subunit beta [Gammaproteobacteria bacterium]